MIQSGPEAFGGGDTPPSPQDIRTLLRAPHGREYAFLVELAGPAVGQVHDIHSQAVIGRLAEVDVAVRADDVSRRHARVHMRDGHAYVTDLGSRNGTYVNDAPVREEELKSGDLVRLGGTTVLKFVWGEDVEAAYSRRLQTTHEELLATRLEHRKAQARLAQVEKLAALGQLAAGIGHEINNPLSYISANLGWVADQIEDLGEAPERVPECAAALREASEGVERIRVIVRDLRTLSPSRPDRLEAVDVNAALETAVKLTSSEIGHRARMVRSYGDLPRAYASEPRLVQVFVNLLLNAGQAIPEGAGPQNAIRLTTRTNAAGRVVAEVSDTGVGIAPEVLGKIFDPFFTTKGPRGGTGLGLSVSHQLVHSMEGELTVDSTPGSGSTFCVVLRAAEGTEAGATAGDRPARRRERPVRVLVVDQEPRVGASLRRALEHEVHAAGSAREALELLGTAGPFDVVLCEARLLDATLPQLCDRLDSQAPGIRERIVFLLGAEVSPETQQFLDKVPNLRLDKPLDVQNLRALIRAVTRPES